MTNPPPGSWGDDLSARERVRKFATTLTEPRSVEWERYESNKRLLEHALVNHDR